MGIDFTKFEELLDNMSQEEIDNAFPDDTRPKGWLSIEDYLPMMLAIDIFSGGTEYKVRYEDGKEGTSTVGDHNAWYYYAKDSGITHWLNE